MTTNTVSVESDLCLISCLHPKYHCKLKQSCQLCKTDRCIYSILLKSLWGSSMTQMLQQKNRVNGSKIKISQEPKTLKFLNLMPLARCGLIWLIKNIYDCYDSYDSMHVPHVGQYFGMELSARTVPTPKHLVSFQDSVRIFVPQTLQ